MPVKANVKANIDPADAGLSLRIFTIKNRP
jgi:hypothetical protein